MSAVNSETDKKRDVSIEQDDVVLKRELGLPSTIGIVLGQIIGSGIFVMPKGTARGGGSVGLTMIMWVLGGVFTAFGAIATAELATLIPKTGGRYNYFKVVYGRWVGFLYCWKVVTFGSPASMAIMSLTFSKYSLAMFFQDGCGEAPQIITKLLAILVLFTLAAVNCYSVKLAARIHIVASSGKVLALVMIIIGGMVMIFKGNTKYINPSTSFDNTNTDPVGIALGFYSCLFAYSGWDVLTTVCEEVKNPAKDIPRTFWTSCVLVTVLYVLTNLSYFTVMSVESLLASPAVGVTWATSVIPSVAWIVPACVGLSTFGSINASVMGASRYHFTIAREGIWPGVLSMINVKRYTPVPAVLITLVFSVAYVLMGDIPSLLNFLSFIEYLALGMKMVALLILRRTMKNAPRPFKTNLLFPVIYGLFCFALFFVPLIGKPQMEFLYASLLVMAGFLAYIIFVKFDQHLSVFDKFVCCLQLWLEVSPQSISYNKT